MHIFSQLVHRNYSKVNMNAGANARAAKLKGCHSAWVQESYACLFVVNEWTYVGARYLFINCCSSLRIPILIRPHIYFPTASCEWESVSVCPQHRRIICIHRISVRTHCHDDIDTKKVSMRARSFHTHTLEATLTIIDIIVVWKANQTRLPQYDAVRVGAKQQQQL